MVETNIVPYKTLLESEDWTYKFLDGVTSLSQHIKSVKEQSVNRELHLNEAIKLSNLVEINPEKVNKDMLNPNEIFDYIDVSSISSKTGLIIEIKAVEGKDLPARARLQVRGGDVLLSTVRPERNIVALVPSGYDGCIVNSTLAVLRPKKEVSGEILYFLLRSEWIQKMLNIKARGTAIPTLSIKDIKDIELPISMSTLVEKQNDARCLYDKWLECNQLIKPLQQVIEETLIDHEVIIEKKDITTHDTIFKVYPYGKLQDRLDVGYYFNETNFILDASDEIVRFKNIIKDIKSGVTPATTAKFSDTGVPFIRIRDLEDEDIYIQPKDVIYIDRDYSYSKNAISKNNVLISKVGTVGKVALVQDEMEGAIINQHLIAVELKEHIIPEYFVYYLKTSWARQEFERRSGGSAQQFIKIQGIEEIPVPLPSIEKQHNIVENIRKKTTNNPVEELRDRIEDFLIKITNNFNLYGL